MSRIRYGPQRRRVFSSRYRRPRADNPISDIAFIFNALEVHPFRSMDTGIAVEELAERSKHLRLFSKLHDDAIVLYIMFIVPSVALFWRTCDFANWKIDGAPFLFRSNLIVVLLFRIFKYKIT
jgi:hypothetical protein